MAVIGCAVNAGAQLLWLTQIQVHPAYLTHLLPAQLLGGAGVGLAIPSLLGAGSASLPPAHFGTGSGILNMARQVGTVLGVASLVAILSRVVPGDPLAAYRHGLILIIAFFAASGVVSAGLLTARPRPQAARNTQGVPWPGEPFSSACLGSACVDSLEEDEGSVSTRVLGRGEGEQRYTARGSVMFFKALAEQDDGDFSLMERTSPPAAAAPRRTGTPTAPRPTSCWTGWCRSSSPGRN